jgi:hypothetical protein
MKNSDVASCHGVKGRLAKNIKFWEKIGANNFVLETLRKGYVIPFLENPVKMFKKNNRSAMKMSNLLIKPLMNLFCLVVQLKFLFNHTS